MWLKVRLLAGWLVESCLHLLLLFNQCKLLPCRSQSSIFFFLIQNIFLFFFSPWCSQCSSVFSESCSVPTGMAASFPVMMPEKEKLLRVLNLLSLRNVEISLCFNWALFLKRVIEGLIMKPQKGMFCHFVK